MVVRLPQAITTMRVRAIKQLIIQSTKINNNVEEDDPALGQKR
jgi:hypothetical protein